MTGRRATAALAAALVSVALAATGCSGASDEAAALRMTVGDLSSVLLRAMAETEFERKGYRIKGKLECAAQPDDDTAATVECSGITRDDAPARFEGRIDHTALADQDAADESLPGSYFGTVADQEVFRLNCFNCRPANSEPEPDPSSSAPDPKIGE